MERSQSPHIGFFQIGLKDREVWGFCLYCIVLSLKLMIVSFQDIHFLTYLVWVCLSATAHMWRSENNQLESAPSLHRVGPRDGTWVSGWVTSAST